MTIKCCHLCQHSSGGCTGACSNHQLGRAEFPPKGCICPPTSEKTCLRWDCGRKPAQITGAGTITPAARALNGGE